MGKLLIFVKKKGTWNVKDVKFTHCEWIGRDDMEKEGIYAFARDMRMNDWTGSG